eukprot:5574833-Prymnesium_polylepis.1
MFDPACYLALPVARSLPRSTNIPTGLPPSPSPPPRPANRCQRAGNETSLLRRGLSAADRPRSRFACL